ncbi:MAG TPA: phenylalanine 4-monooxygenase [Planctomycetota bacterium]|nr:phenylalanine 4-monooxygenase [Planctomycetota bacterium]
MYITQDYSKYTPEDHKVWTLLYERRIPDLKNTACSAFLKGVEQIGLDSRHVPKLSDVNARLRPLTGWQAMPVPGYLPARDFFQSLSERKFPTTITVRPMSQLDYLPEPDIFHDVFGHVPLHADPVFADFLQHYGKVALATHDEQELVELARLFWFTVEFGLIRENGVVKLFGSGLMSSAGEGPHALSAEVERRNFDLQAVISQPFEIDHYQPLLFVIDSFEQLYDAVETWARGGVHAHAK